MATQADRHRGLWLWYLAYYRPYGGRVLAYLGLAVVQASLLGPPVFILKIAFDTAIPSGDTRLILLLGAAAALSRVVAGLVAMTARKVATGVTRSATRDLRGDGFAALYETRIDVFARNDPHRLHPRMVQDTERVETAATAMAAAAPPLAGIAALGAALVWLNWPLALLIGLVGPLMWLALRLSGRGIGEATCRFREVFENFSKDALFALTHLQLTRTRGVEDEALAGQRAGLERLRLAGETMAMAFAGRAQFHLGFTSLGAIAVMVAGGLAVSSGAMSLGGLLSFYLAAALAVSQVNRLAGLSGDIVSARESLVVLRELVELGPPAPRGGSRLPQLSGGLRLKGVGMSLGGKVVLEDLSFHVAPGATVAIVGPNGSGKTTLLNLMLGFYRADRGELFIDGEAYAEVDLRALRRSVGVAPQSPTFFSGTILENIAYGRPQAGRDEVVSAARLAGADAFIEALPEGYDTQIGESGARLSGGERQRLAIARAVLGSPRLLILDEPTNHLDADGVRAIILALSAPSHRPSMIIASHDPAAIGLADQVIRLEAGRMTTSTPDRAALVQ